MKFESLALAVVVLIGYDCLKRYINRRESGQEENIRAKESTGPAWQFDVSPQPSPVHLHLPPPSFPLSAIFFAVGNFNRLASFDTVASLPGRYLTQESLRKAYWYGGFSLDERKAVLYLLQNLERFGRVLGKSKETTFVGGSGWAMPVTFEKTVYGYATEELLKAMRELADEAKLDPAAYLKAP